MSKLTALEEILRGMGSAVLAYSGGTDSTFLLKVASEVLGEKLLAVTADSPTYPAEELAFARSMAKQLKARHRVIRTREFLDKRFVRNPVDRCYYCKGELFKQLRVIARKDKLKFVIDASNLSDKKDFRPGAKAKEAFGVRSPLQEAGFSKAEIRRESRQMGLKSWDMPAQACLASRVPYGTALSEDILKRIEQAESLLRGLGFRQCRLRHHRNLCRVEVPKRDIPRLIVRRGLVLGKLKGLGYNYVTVDLQGYRTGSLNEEIER